MNPPPNSDNDHTVLAPGAAFPNALQPGTKLGEFEITCVVGQGGFGIVYHAKDHSLGRDVAVKEYMPAAFAGRVGGTQVTMLSEHYAETFQVGLHSFVNEAQLLAQFDHPCLVKVYRFWEANGTGYMAMPFYQAPTLKQLLKEDHTLLAQEDWLRNFLAHILDALEVLHAKQCYHRDIAPDNILMLENDRPLLLDFGAARRVIGDMTQALTVILKPGYAPIEQYGDMTNMSQGPWTDFYALASVVYFIITDKVPPAALTRLVSDSLVPLTESAADRYSPEFLRAIDAGLGVRPEQRPQNVAEFRALLGIEQPQRASAPRATATQPGAVTQPGIATQGGTGRTGAPTQSRTTGLPVQDEAAATPPRKSRWKAVLLSLFGLTVLGAGGGGGWLWWNNALPFDIPYLPPPPGAKPAAVAAVAPPPPVIAPAPEAAPAESATASASASAEAAAPVAEAPPAPPPPPPCPLKLADGTPGCPSMVAIPAGTYRMGSQAGEPGALPEEMGGKPAPIAAFDLSAQEISYAQWQLCVKDRACPAPQGMSGPDLDKLPVTGISWDAAKGYADWLSKKTGGSYRLPTEAEWEFAARSGTSTIFPWGDRAGQDNAHCGQCGSHLDFHRPAPVGSFKAYAGLYDMVGNVYEWVDDCWHASHAEDAKITPAQTTAACKKRVQKGGAFDSTSGDVRPVARTFGDRTSSDPRVGFRIGRTPPPAPAPAAAAVGAAATPAAAPTTASTPAAALSSASAATPGAATAGAAAASQPASAPRHGSRSGSRNTPAADKQPTASAPPATAY
ncbi:bifunctional serine/threonine-protein kinase/formylglycine-generating enzyme family protein [Rugamonas apoptosis]|uniref:SUMF1/EgtB/PvdO family nonheme iron enzyme n=1 Tax=Rugamonas apoptosis TaxID=2758570 RepID=A0A7W2IKG7_9BURK|nr:bifunctional serine/threonine-protein kinase/formylglycine-generating enzyme family protein [Rugamonas apoptosis]MBA5687765.1 SUMF1/EgtB/PvdO family nonheme iron enzyme [Rugamonas apoptosis]